ncbi:MAG: NACHT domain-containing protein [Syntrophomonadaceae bacterium]|jgi:energy-coupling factor transporter ATP-binding protein EcfA2|nr:NACHT domain-containing protein [Syntrophomonadaceae bacterium]
MLFLPIDRMIDRLNIDKSDSESTYFNSLLLLGEMAIKIITLGLLAGVENGREPHRYSLEYRLARADSIGEWMQIIDEITTGVTSQNIIEPVRDEQKELIMKTKRDAWQYSAVEKMIQCVNIINNEKKEELSSNVKLARWFSLFASLRNSTRGHGATLSSQYALMCRPLFESTEILLNNFIIFKRSWAFLHRTLSGKYRVVPYTADVSGFNDLKTTEAIQKQINYSDGIYIYFDKPYKIDLIYTDVDSRDFFFPNGNFTNKTFEALSYVTNNKMYCPNENYLMPAVSLPASETQGIGSLDAQGECFGNIPEKHGGYIKRDVLEKALYNVLIDDRHPIITLIGRGGIGKTTLALEVLRGIAKEGKFDFILWFSARDIDLLSKGPKPVKAHVQTIEEIADEFVSLIGMQYNTDNSSNKNYLAKMMSANHKILFVFDNFETTKSPVDLYNWIDVYIRLPNKVLITSRIRDFKGDFPIEITGMNESESKELINKTAKELRITEILTAGYIDSLADEACGHPYVMKVLLGEVAKEGRLKKIDRIIASMDNILEALFERTYTGLSPAAKRVFLTLCAWNSPISQLGLEAVLLRSVNERMNVEEAVKELRYSSFAEEKNAGNGEDDNETGIFLSVPLAAAEFGKKKMLTYPYVNSIKADIDILHLFGAIKMSNIEKGIQPRIEHLIHNIRQKVNSGERLINEYEQMLEYIASRYVSAWLLLADLYQNYGLVEKYIYALNRYIESGTNDLKSIQHAWTRLAKIYETQNDPNKEIHALIELSKIPNTSFFVISDTANKINGMLRNMVLDQSEKELLVEQLANIMEKRISECDADDCSRLAWLFLHLHKGEDARRIAEKGLSIEHDNMYCQNILTRLDS